MYCFRNIIGRLFQFFGGIEVQLNYKYNSSGNIKFSSGFDKENYISYKTIYEAMLLTHKTLDKFSEFEVDVFSLLGMRNLSAFVGETFVSSLARVSNGLLMKNPHQDGYPDLLLLDSKGKEILSILSEKMKEKEPFSPFINGGIEVKATCGVLPSAQYFTKHKLPKPDIYDQRISYLKGYDWKAHHRQTNNLIGIVWDFIDRRIRIVSIFFSSSLETEDWGKIVQPRDGGGRTTSVSIMTREGVKKMYNGNVVMIDDPQYIKFFETYNS